MSMLYLIHYAWQDFCRIEKNRLIRKHGGDEALVVAWEGEKPSLLYWSRHGTLERLVYNESTNVFFVVGRAGNFRTSCQSFSVTGPHFTVHEPSRTLFYLIPKNANSTQMGTVLHELGLRPRQGSPSQVWGAAAQRHLVYHQDYDAEKYGSYTHVAVYRDPVDRFVNLANYAWCIDRGFLAPYTCGCESRASLVETILLLIAMNRANHPGPFEQHLEGQAWYYDRAPRVDVVVPVGRLNDYMRRVMKVEPFPCNVDRRNDLTEKDLTPRHKEMIRDVWKEDFTLEDRFGSQFWQASTGKGPKEKITSREGGRHE